LHKAKAIVKAGQTLIPGVKVITELLHRERERCVALIYDEGVEPHAVGVHDISTIWLSSTLFRELDRWGTGSPLLLMHVDPLPKWTSDDWPDGCTLILPFQDPHNVGAALRSAAAFDVSAVILCTEAAHPYHPDAVRPAAGAQSLLPLFAGPSVHDVRALPRPLFVLDLHGMPLSTVKWSKRFGLLAGSEGQGIPVDLGDIERVTIPTEPVVESLNAMAAVSVALYAWSMQRS
jgi:16S rRNA (guanine527-N7)-methyltransferase